MLVTGPKKDWAITPHAFERLLGWLDEGNDSAGQTYLEMRERLVSYFDRKNCGDPDTCADETLNRVARRLDEENGQIITDSPAKYCYITARFVFMESLRRDRTVSIDCTLKKPLAAVDRQAEAERKEYLQRCLDRCMNKLARNDQELILSYYYGEQSGKIANRRSLAERLGITPNALTIRACRMRQKLESCVRQCVGFE